MTSEQMKDLLHRHPFVPIRLKMNDGRTVDVLFPDLTLVASQEMFVGYKDPKSTKRVAQDGVYVSFRHIKDFSPLTPSDVAASRS